MNTASQSRLSLARHIAPVYAANAKVAAVMLGGSAARGHADRYSDVEIGVFWHEPPDDAERRQAIATVGGDLIYLYPFDEQEQVWSDDFMMGRAPGNQPRSGVLVELVNYTTKFIDLTLDEVLLRHRPDDGKLNLIAGITEGIPLSGFPIIGGWQKRAAVYPEELAVAVVRKHAIIDHFWRWEMWLQRGNNLMMLYAGFSQVQQKLLHVLLALNRVYYFGFKWLDPIISRLRIAPSNLAPRLSQVYQVPPAKGAQQLAALVEETFDLVEQHLSTVNVARLREVFRYQRPFWEEVPGLLP